MKGASGTPTSPLWLIGRDYGQTEAAQGKPFVGKAGGVLDGILQDAGVRRADAFIDNVVQEQPASNDWDRHRPGAVEAGVSRLQSLIQEHQPQLVVPFGNEAFRTVMGYEPDDSRALPPITNARGYLFDSLMGPRVLPAVHPSFTMRPGNWVPWRILSMFDLRKAKRELELGCPPIHEPEVTTLTSESEFAAVKKALDQRQAQGACVAMDIENDRQLDLACLGIACSRDHALVIPCTGEAWQLQCVSDALSHPVRKAFQNGSYDNYFLTYMPDYSLEERIAKYGLEIVNWTDDTMLMWHVLFPELAGVSVDKEGKRRGTKTTAKSLSLFASLLTRVTHWKNYDFANEQERYELCGKDCCVTLEALEVMEEDLA